MNFTCLNCILESKTKGALCLFDCVRQLISMDEYLILPGMEGKPTYDGKIVAGGRKRSQKVRKFRTLHDQFLNSKVMKDAN